MDSAWGLEPSYSMQSMDVCPLEPPLQFYTMDEEEEKKRRRKKKKRI